MSTKSLIAASLADDIVPVVVYLFIGVMVTWIFFAFVLQKAQHDSPPNSKSNHKWWRWMIHGAHSLALAHVSLFIGPMYVIMKLFEKPACFLVWGTLLHIFVELLGFGAVLVTLGANRMMNPMPHWLAWETFCYHPQKEYAAKGLNSTNEYLSCNGFIGAVCLLILVFLVSTLVFASMVAKRDTNTGESQHHVEPRSVLRQEYNGHQLAIISNEMETCTIPETYRKNEQELTLLHYLSNDV